MTSAPRPVTIFGAGNMGSAIGGLVDQAGGTVQHLRSSTPPTHLEGEIVVLAVPYEAVSGIVEGYREQLDGRIVVDLTNPVDFETLDSLKVAGDSSAAAELAQSVPGARVVKAFNTNFAGTLASRQVGPNPTTVLVAGNDEDAKGAVLALVRSVGKDLGDATAGKVRGGSGGVGQEPYADRTVEPATCLRSFGGQVVASDDDEVLPAVLDPGLPRLLRRRGRWRRRAVCDGVAEVLRDR